MSCKILTVGSLAMLIAGCASQPANHEFASVEQLVTERTGHSVQWNRGSADDARVSEEVANLLRGELQADTAVQVALLNNPALQARFERFGIAQADLLQAGLLTNPVFSASIRSSSIGTEREFGVVLNFLDLLTLAARKRVAAENSERAKLEVALAVVDLATEVRTNYYAAVADEQLLAMERQVLEAAQAAAELARRQQTAGTLSRRDMAIQQSFHAREKLALARQETQAAASREKLIRSFGLREATGEWRLPTRLPEPELSVPELSGLEAMAEESRLDLAATRKEIKALDEALAYNRDFRFLSVLGIGFSTQHGSDGEMLRGPNVELGLPLFDRGEARIARLEAEGQAKARELQALSVAARSQVREAHVRLMAARDAVEQYRTEVLPLQKLIVDETQLNYNGMLVGVYDLLLARQGQISAGGDYIAALRDYWISLAELERATGKALPVTTSSALPVAPELSHAHQHGGTE